MTSISVRKCAIFLPDADTPALANLHVGQADALTVDLPLGESTDLAARLRTYCAESSPRGAAFAGSVLYRFDCVLEHHATALEALTETCTDADADPMFVASSHDTTLAMVQSGEVHDEYRLAGGALVCHGCRGPDGDARRYVADHDHPTFIVRGRWRPRVLYRLDAYHGGDVLMLSAFTRFVVGVGVSGVRGADLNSPLVRKAGYFRPFIRDAEAGEMLAFPSLGELRRLL